MCERGGEFCIYKRPIKINFLNSKVFQTCCASNLNPLYLLSIEFEKDKNELSFTDLIIDIYTNYRKLGSDTN